MNQPCWKHKKVQCMQKKKKNAVQFPFCYDSNKFIMFKFRTEFWLQLSYSWVCILLFCLYRGAFSCHLMVCDKSQKYGRKVSGISKEHSVFPFCLHFWYLLSTDRPRTNSWDAAKVSNQKLISSSFTQIFYESDVSSESHRGRTCPHIRSLLTHTGFKDRLVGTQICYKVFGIRMPLLAESSSVDTELTSRCEAQMENHV